MPGKKPFVAACVLLLNLNFARASDSSTTEIAGFRIIGEYPILNVPVVEGRLSDYDVTGSKCIVWILIIASCVGSLYTFCYFLPQQVMRFRKYHDDGPSSRITLE